MREEEGAELIAQVQREIPGSHARWENGTLVIEVEGYLPEYIASDQVGQDGFWRMIRSWRQRLNGTVSTI